MKNILKLSSLIAGLSLCMMENPTQESQVTTVYTVGGNELAIVDTEITVFELVQKLQEQCPLNPGLEYNLMLDDNKLSPRDIIPAGSNVQSIISEQNITLRVSNGCDATVTLYGDLTAICQLKLLYDIAEDGGSRNLTNIPYDEYMQCMRSTYINMKKDNLHDLFLRDEISTAFCSQVSQYLSKIVTSSGQVFIKNPEQSNRPDKDNAYNLLFAIHEHAREPEYKVTQQDIDGFVNQILGYSSQWTLESNS